MLAIYLQWTYYFGKLSAMACYHVPTGVRILAELLDALPEGRVFTTEEAVDAGSRLGLTPSHVHKVLSEMSGTGGILDRPRRGLYVMHPPFGGRDEVRPIAVAARALQPSAVAGQSALAFWTLVDQVPLKYETLVTPARPTPTAGMHPLGDHATWKWGGGAFEFRRVSTSQYFGIRDVRVDCETVVPMFDAERSVLEELVRSPGAGAAILEEHRDALDLPRLYGYAQRLGEPVVALVDRTLARQLVAA